MFPSRMSQLSQVAKLLEIAQRFEPSLFDVSARDAIKFERPVVRLVVGNISAHRPQFVRDVAAAHDSHPALAQDVQLPSRLEEVGFTN